MNTKVAIAVSLLCAITPAAARGQSAEELLSSCRPVEEASVTDQQVAFAQTYATGECWGAFGVVQELIVLTNGNKRPIVAVCAPSQSTRTQLVAVFVRYAEAHPERLHERFLDVALDALREAFPCRK